MPRFSLPPARSHFDDGRIERLEPRIAPAVLASVTGHTLYLTGDAGANAISIDAVAGDKTVFSITSSVDTINGSDSAYTTPSGIKNIVVNLKDGADTLNIGSGGTIALLGNLKINGGDGGNTVNFNQLSLGKNVIIKNGTGRDVATWVDTVIKGSASILNGDGGSSMRVSVSSADARSAIKGDLTIINGSGADSHYFTDTQIGHNITVQNGPPDSTGAAGGIEFDNLKITDHLSTIGGNFSVSYAGGNYVNDSLFDTYVRGNVTYDYGTSKYFTGIDGFHTNIPSVIQGKLSITGTGQGNIFIGGGENQTGLNVGAIALNLSQADSAKIYFNQLEVAGRTKIAIGGTDALTIDGSTFHGDFSYITGSSGNAVNIEQRSGTAEGTTFEGAANFIFQGGITTFAMAGTDDSEETVIADESIIIHQGGGAFTANNNLAQILFPFGGSLQLLP